MSNDAAPERSMVAQDRHYATALSEIKSGRKSSHCMWYIFPQIDGLGYSEMAKCYAIKDLPEATAFLAHDLPGARLIDISKAILTLPGSNATQIMGSPDDPKLRSSMTLFSEVPGADPVFEAVLHRFFHGHKDQATLEILDSVQNT